MNLDAPLLQLSPVDFFTYRDAFNGVSVTGSIGSGKTSGTGKALAHAYLRAGMGGLVLCAKPEEAVLWRRYAAETGRQGSLIEITADNHGFNFLAYEIARQGGDGVNSVIECLMRVLEAARSASGSNARAGEAFWEDTTRQILRHTIPALFAAYRRITIPDIIEFVRSAPRTPQEAANPAWQKNSLMSKSVDAVPRGGPMEAVINKVVSFWENEYAHLDPKVRSNIAISLTTTLDRFNHGWLQHALCGRTSVVPDLCFHGAVILLNLPALTLNEDGIIAQQVWKYMWQRAVLARNALPRPFQERPVFLWADEAQYFINSYDAEFLSTSRASRVCTVFLSQSLPTYFARMAGEGGHDKVHHLLGNFGTKIWHSNTCPETNEWAARTVGRMLQRRSNFSENEGFNSSYGMNKGEGSNTGGHSGSNYSYSKHGGGGGSSYGSSWGRNDSRGESKTRGESSGTSQGFSEQMDWIIEPAAFGRMLQTGGPANRGLVSSIWYQGGKRFEAGGRNFLMTVFRQ